MKLLVRTGENTGVELGALGMIGYACIWVVVAVLLSVALLVEGAAWVLSKGLEWWEARDE